MCIKSSPRERGDAWAWGGFYTTGAFIRLIQGINRSVIRQSIILIVKLMSFKTSVLIWFSRFRGTASPPAPLPRERVALGGDVPTGVS